MFKNLSFINKIVYFLNILSALALILSYISPYVNPNIFWPISIIGLGYLVLFFINVSFLIYWLILRNRRLLLSLVVILFGYNSMNNHINYNLFKDGSQLSENSISIMSYNVKQFGLYNYNKDWSYNYTYRDSIVKIMETEKPDIICLQESYVDKKKRFTTISNILEVLPDYNVHTLGYSNEFKIGLWGGTILSKYPVIDKGEMLFGDPLSYNTCFYVDVLINNEIIRVYSVHLQSIKLDKEDYEYVDEISDLELKDDYKEKSANIFNKLVKGYEIRAYQANELKNHIENCKYPVIVCGDFNDTPQSYSYKKISSGLSDAFFSSGFGFGRTYANKLPITRIDYILYSDGIIVDDFKVIKKKFSDHYPIMCNFELK